MAERSADWYRQAQRDLDSAKAQLESKFFEWACFIAQQAAEKAIKAVYQKLSAEAWGHSVNDLLKGLQQNNFLELNLGINEELLERAKRLDRFYIPARYPNGWSTGLPADYITEKDAKDAISDSEEILRFCKDILAG